MHTSKGPNGRYLTGVSSVNFVYFIPLVHRINSYYWPTDARVPRLDTEGFKTFADGEVLTLAPEQDMFHRCCKCGSVHKLTIRAVSHKDSSILPVPITISAKRYV